MDNKGASCLSMVVVLFLLYWIIPDSIKTILLILIVALIVVGVLFGIYCEYYKDLEQIKLRYVDKHYEYIDNSVKKQDEYIEEGDIENASIDERIAYLKRMCTQVSKEYKEEQGV